MTINMHKNKQERIEMHVNTLASSIKSREGYKTIYKECIKEALESENPEHAECFKAEMEADALVAPILEETLEKIRRLTSNLEW